MLTSATLSAFLNDLFAASWQGSLTLLLILAVRTFLPVQWRSALWLCFLVRLLLPTELLPSNPVSLQNLPVIGKPLVEFEELQEPIPPSIANESLQANPVPMQAPSSPRRTFPWQQLIGIVWLCGAAGVLSATGIAAWRIRARISRESEPVDAETAAIWERCIVRYGGKGAPRLRHAKWIAVPALSGVFSPVLLLPTAETNRFKPAEWEHIFLHELAHFRRRDHWINAAQFLVLALHWFNPLIWLGMRFLRLDRELAADAAALNHLPPHKIKEYGSTLLKAISRSASLRFRANLVGIAEDSHQLKTRVLSIVNFKPTTIRRSIIGCLVIAMVATVVMGKETPLPVSPDSKTAEIAIPAARGHILDREGMELATNRHQEGLYLILPPQLPAEAEAIAFVQKQLERAGDLLHRRIAPPEKQKITRAYRDHSPLLLSNLSAKEQALLLRAKGMTLVALPIYTRFYPQGAAFAHLVGFAPDEGQDGLEATFNASLAGREGRLQLRFSDSGELLSRKVITKAQAGTDLHTTLDGALQRASYQHLNAKEIPGAIVIADPRTGNLLAMTSWPSFDPNTLIPAISSEAFQHLMSNPQRPLLGRAYRSRYPMGRLFRIWSGIAAIQSGAIAIDERLATQSSMEIDGYQFQNPIGAKTGDFTFRGALMQHSFTWFYQAGIKTGEPPIRDWAERFGLLQKTGIPLPGESAGWLEASQSKSGLPSNGYLANLAVGNTVLATPLQVTKAMAILANEGKSLEIKLIQGATAKPIPLGLKPALLAELRQIMEAPDSISSFAAFTSQGHPRAGSKITHLTWYAGYAPTHAPTVAFAVILEYPERHASQRELHSIIRALLSPATKHQDISRDL